MLSKAEIQYLQGQKQVSKSYERKLKCLIRKKIEVLEKEIPLLSSLFAKNIKSIFSEHTSQMEWAPSTMNQEKNNILVQNSSNTKNAATDFSNAPLSDNGHNEVNFNVDCEGREGLNPSPVPQLTIEATKFSNGQMFSATKNSNLVLNQRRERDLNPRGPHGPQAL